MGFKSNIRKILVIGLWCLLAAGMLVLLVAAIKVRSHKTCKGYKIEIKGSGDELFIDKKEIDNILIGSGGYTFTGKKLSSIDLNSLEDMLMRNPWIKRAELFFDNSQVLRVNIKERQPIARIFTSGGNSFYIDDAGEYLPLSGKHSARLPVFTGFPSEKKVLNNTDSLLMKDVIQLSGYIAKNNFWMAQIAQVDITAARTFELIPTIGTHVIEFGNAQNYEQKFNRLFMFYQRVLSKAGFNKYERIKVQYEKQIVGVKKAIALSKYDSLQAVKNVQRLIMDVQKQQQELLDTDSVSTISFNNQNIISDTVSNYLRSIQSPTITSQQNPSLKSHPYESSKSVTKPKAMMKKQ